MRTLASSIVLVSASTAFAGPDWTEGSGLGGSDARKNPPGQMVVFPPRGGAQVTSADERAWGLAPAAEYAAILARTLERDFRPRFARLGITLPPGSVPRPSA